MTRYRRILGAAVVTGVLWLAGALSANAQCGNLWVPCESGHLRVQFDVPANADRPEILGFHLYRRALGACGSDVRLTTVPWLRTPATNARYEYTDTAVESNVEYSYWVVGVDGAGHEVSLLDCYYNPPLVFASCGLAAIAHGTIDAGGWITNCTPCWNSLARLFTFPPEMAQYFGTGTTLLMYGEAGCTGVKGCVMDVQSFQVAPCTIGVDRAAWGLVKIRFR